MGYRAVSLEFNFSKNSYMELSIIIISTAFFYCIYRRLKYPYF